MRHRLTGSAALLIASWLSISSGLAATMELTPGGGRALLQVWSLRELKVRSVVLQQYDYSCGSAALATLLTYHYRHPITEEVAFRSMFDQGDQEKIKQEGFSLLDMKQFLESHGFQADGYEVSLDDVAKAEIPAIVLMVDNGYHHFVVLKGIRNDSILLGDPAVGLRILTREQFEAAWPSRIVFVIHPDAKRGEFNATRDWSVRPRASLGTALTPDMLSTITLFARGRSDF